MTKAECYRILELPVTASIEEVRKSYIRLSKQYHPDINPEGRQKFQKINEAYNRIKNGQFSNIPNSQDALFWLNMFHEKDYHEKLRIVTQLLLFFIVSVLPILFLLKSLVTQIIYWAVALIEYSFYSTKYILISILYIATVIAMNLMDLGIYAILIVYNLTIRPIFFLSSAILRVLAPTLQEFKLLIVVCTSIVLLVKLYEYSHYRKIGVLIASMIVLMVVIISDFFM